MDLTRTVLHTARVPPEWWPSTRVLMDAAFDDFTDEDWEHALGGEHAFVVEESAAGSRVVAHGALVLRRCLHRGRVLRMGYVEAVAVEPARQRQGHGGWVMSRLEALAPAFDLLALGASEAGRGLYERRGWVPWRGPTSVLGPEGVVATPDEDGHVLVLVPPDRSGGALDLDAALTCDWREGDVW